MTQVPAIAQCACTCILAFMPHPPCGNVHATAYSLELSGWCAHTRIHAPCRAPALSSPPARSSPVARAGPTILEEHPVTHVSTIITTHARASPHIGAVCCGGTSTWCRADTDQFPWWDASLNATWRGTIFATLADFGQPGLSALACTRGQGTTLACPTSIGCMLRTWGSQ